jgi:hypothetical protein
MRRWIGPECNNGIRDGGLKQKLQSNKRIKDLGGRLPLCPRNERTSRWTYRKTIDSVKGAKQKADLTSRRGKSRTGPCGGVDLLRKGNKNGG